MNRKAFFVIGALMVLVATSVIVGKLSSAKAQVETGAPAPDLTLPDVKGGSVTLSAYKGKVIILDFWASFCPPCRQEIPDFIKLFGAYKDKGLMIVGVSVDRTSVDELKKFCRSMKITYPVLIADKGTIERYGGIRYIPTTFIIDKDMKIVKKFIGYTSRETFESEIKKLL